MKTRRTSPFLIFAALGGLAALFAAGAVAVLERRASSGDDYAHYASYRSDPLGTSALYESFAQLEGYETSRNTTFLNSIEGLDAETCLLLIGLPRESVSGLRGGDDSPVIAALEEGARLVVTINPGVVSNRFQPAQSDEERGWLERRRRLIEEREKQRERDRKRSPDSEESPATEEPEETGGTEPAEESDAPEETDPSDEPGPSEDSDPSEDPEEEEEEEKDETLREFEASMTSALGPRLTERWSFGVTPRRLGRSESPVDGWETESALDGAFAAPLWHSPLHFHSLGEAWRVVLRRDGDPVMIERSVGKGSVVLASDSYFLSNEALHLGADPDLLLWLLGGKRRLVFDETIHGSQESGGAMKLLRQHRLHGIVVGLLGFVLLWGWRSASSLAPGSDELDLGVEGEGGAVTGAAQASGFISLLRRSVPARELLARCVEEWRHARLRNLSKPEEDRVAEILSAPESDAPSLLARYREIAEIFRRR